LGKRKNGPFRLQACRRTVFARWYFRNNPREHKAITSAEPQALPIYAGVKESPATP